MLWTLLVVMFAGNPAPADTKFAVMEASIERQRASIRKQGSASEPEGAFFILPPPARLWQSTADPADCPALSEQELQLWWKRRRVRTGSNPTGWTSWYGKNPAAALARSRPAGRKG